jgi:hypothetical protein
MLTPSQQLKQALDGTASVQVTHLYGLGRSAVGAADIADWPHAQIIETLDQKTCPLCRHLHGMILSKTDPRYHEYKYPSHIHCRRIMVDIGKGELNDDGTPLTPNFTDPPRALVERYGHFQINPDKYSALRIPARPEGRDFLYVPGKAGEPHRLIWRPGLSDEARRATIQDMTAELLAHPESLPQSANLLRQLAQWATEEADFVDLSAVLASRAAWPAITTDLQLTELAYRLAAGSAAVCVIEQAGVQRVGLWSPNVPLPGGLSATDVALLLDPITGQLLDIQQRPRSWFTSHPGFKNIEGFAPGD